MKARFALACLSLCVLVAACATSTGGGSGSAGTPAPAGSADAGSAGTGSTGSASAGTGSVAADASGSSTGARAGSADPGVPAKTAAERRADLDGKLDDSLNNFDEKLRREQQRTAADRDSEASARADGAVVDATSNGERDGDDFRRDRSGDLQSDGLQQDADAAASDLKGKGNGVAAKPIPSGVDDDIIARRLRRAAENETDPELKEKLWAEYRDYKENTKGSK